MRAFYKVTSILFIFLILFTGIVLEPNMTALKNTSANLKIKEAAEFSENSPKPQSAPGFLHVYAVAVIARDNATNYDMRGPVQTYEDMNITLEKGWNLK